MKITISKSQWEGIGKQAGWMQEKAIPFLKEKVSPVLDPRASHMPKDLNDISLWRAYFFIKPGTWNYVPQEFRSTLYQDPKIYDMVFSYTKKYLIRYPNYYQSELEKVPEFAEKLKADPEVQSAIKKWQEKNPNGEQVSGKKFEGSFSPGTKNQYK